MTSSLSGQNDSSSLVAPSTSKGQSQSIAQNDSSEKNDSFSFNVPSASLLNSKNSAMPESKFDQLQLEPFVKTLTSSQLSLMPADSTHDEFRAFLLSLSKCVSHRNGFYFYSYLPIEEVECNGTKMEISFMFLLATVIYFPQLQAQFEVTKLRPYILQAIVIASKAKEFKNAILQSIPLIFTTFKINQMKLSQLSSFNITVSHTILRFIYIEMTCNSSSYAQATMTSIWTDLTKSPSIALLVNLNRLYQSLFIEELKLFTKQLSIPQDYEKVKQSFDPFNQLNSNFNSFIYTINILPIRRSDLIQLNYPQLLDQLKDLTNIFIETNDINSIDSLVCLLDQLTKLLFNQFKLFFYDIFNQFIVERQNKFVFGELSKHFPCFFVSLKQNLTALKVVTDKIGIICNLQELKNSLKNKKLIDQVVGCFQSSNPSHNCTEPICSELNQLKVVIECLLQSLSVDEGITNIEIELIPGLSKYFEFEQMKYIQQVFKTIPRRAGLETVNLCPGGEYIVFACWNVQIQLFFQHISVKREIGVRFENFLNDDYLNKDLAELYKSKKGLKRRDVHKFISRFRKMIIARFL